MPEYSVFLPEVLPEAPGCPDVTVEDKAENVVREFCNRTWLWDRWTDLYLDPGVDRYAVNVPGAEIVSIIEVRLDNTPAKPTTGMGAGEADNNYDAPEGTIWEGWMMEPPNFLRLARLPVESDMIFIKTVLRPRRGHGSFPDFIWEAYTHHLVSGVLASLMIQRGTTWYSPDLAVMHNQIFNQGIARAKMNKAKGFTNKNLRVKPRRFA